MAKMQYYGTGRRKSSVARVRLIPGKGNVTINKKSLDDYFGMEILKREVLRPFEIAGVVVRSGVLGRAGGLFLSDFVVTFHSSSTEVA